MTSVPFFYFTLLSIFIYRKNKQVDIALFMTLIFAVSGGFTILMDSYDLIEPKIYNSITLYTTLSYCTLLTLVIIPFIINSNTQIPQLLPIRNNSLLKTLAILSIVWFGIMVLFSYNKIISILTGDMGELRRDVYLGVYDTTSWAKSIPRPIALLMLPFNFIFANPWVLIFLGFYGRCIQKLPTKYFFYFIIASMSGPWVGVLGIDRSTVTYWLIALVANYLFFKKFFDSGQKKRINILMLILLSIAVFYLVLITVSRFSSGDFSDLDDSNNSFVEYIGQPFPFFCYFFGDYSSSWKTLGLIFPFTSKYFLGGPSSGIEIQMYIEKITGVTAGVFNTFIGQISMSAGSFIAVLFCVILFIVSTVSLKRISKRSISMRTSYLYLLFSSVVFLGLFGYYYSTPARTFSVVAFLVIINLLQKRPQNNQP